MRSRANSQRKQSTILYITGTSGRQLLNRSRLLPTTLTRTLPGLFAYLAQDLCEFSRHSNLVSYSTTISWERATTEDCRLALNNLHRKTDIRQKSLEATPFVREALNHILGTSFVALLFDTDSSKGKHCFIDETHTLTSQPKLLNIMPVFKPDPRRLESRSPPSRRALHTVSEADPAWKAPALAASRAVPGLCDNFSEDAGILLVLLSFLTTHENIPPDLLFRGATPKKRWNTHGEIDETDAKCVGLAPELVGLLSDVPKLNNAFHELALSSAVSKKSDQTYAVNGAAMAGVHVSLAPEFHSFWKYQALIVAYRAIPWKYIESR
jgi:hypothetical protein